MARAGFAASGIIHVGIGALAVVLASSGHAEADQSGALRTIAQAPVGLVLLWVMAVALFVLGVWFAVEGALASDKDSGDSKWKDRLSSWGKAIGYLAVGSITAVVAAGGRPSSEKSTEGASGTLLALPGGPFVLGLLGVVVAAVGAYFGWRGITRGFRKDLETPTGPAGAGIVALGAVGYIAKGVALVTVGVLLVVAAVKLDPKAAGGIDGALSALLALPLGPIIVDLIGVGLVAYGVYMVARAFRARMPRN